MCVLYWTKKNLLKDAMLQAGTTRHSCSLRSCAQGECGMLFGRTLSKFLQFYQPQY